MEQIIKDLQEIKAWIAEKEKQQVSLPLDDASANVVGNAIFNGTGNSALTQNLSIPASPTTVLVNKAYAGTVVLNVGGGNYEIPYL